MPIQGMISKTMRAAMSLVRFGATGKTSGCSLASRPTQAGDWSACLPLRSEASSNWPRISGSRRVADGVAGLDQARTREILDIRDKIAGIANALRRGERFQPLIAVQRAPTGDVVLIDGHHRATAYLSTGLPDEIDVLIGTSPHMAGWAFF